MFISAYGYTDNMKNYTDVMNSCKDEKVIGGAVNQYLDHCLALARKSVVKEQRSDLYPWTKPSYGNARCIAKQEEVNKMRTEAMDVRLNVDARPAQTEEAKARDYLATRLHDEYYKKERKLPVFFGMKDQPTPKTAKELAKRLADGLFVVVNQDGKPVSTTDVDAFEDEDAWDYNVLRFLRWRDPATKRDPDGLKAANEKLEVALQEAQDTAAFSTPDQFAKVLADFQSKTFH